MEFDLQPCDTSCWGNSGFVGSGVYSRKTNIFVRSLFLSARFIHFSLVGSLSRGMWRSLSLCIKY
ncbi:unnamed protein product [Brassica rapa]|uniref:Uncharacterized protein n=1 Tax=Brassica campestris TaxID=3711 RepID=A0A8D9H9H3_BRACM|nr:unnamed protein product [Brassica rapa]CAG7895540.1 unnamed protein product [Brassica rapa]CAG7895541.1 unnamed protein product [Brassica rapa]CAG7895542.1 unnamed protein product [Brassica rapa]CAG7895543.1 unnamed protein product [Brassica rapa]